MEQFPKIFTGSPGLMTSHLVTIQSYEGAPKGSYNLVLEVVTSPHPRSHDHILGAQQPAHIYSSLQHPAVT